MRRHVARFEWPFEIAAFAGSDRHLFYLPTIFFFHFFPPAGVFVLRSPKHVSINLKIDYTFFWKNFEKSFVFGLGTCLSNKTRR